MITLFLLFHKLYAELTLMTVTSGIDSIYYQYPCHQNTVAEQDMNESEILWLKDVQYNPTHFGDKASSRFNALHDSRVSGCQLRDSNRSEKPEESNAPICRKRASLTPEMAAAIFGLRDVQRNLCPQSPGAPVHTHTRRSVLVSHMFGVSPKAVRDIWNLRTWRHVTGTMQVVAGDGCDGSQASLRETAIFLTAASSVTRRVGRPRGSKDSRPRRRRVVVTTIGPAAAADEPVHFAAVPQPPCQPQPPAALLSLDCVSSPSPSEEQSLDGESQWSAQPAKARRCPAGGPASVAGCPFWLPAGATAAAAAEDDEPELRRTYPFFLQDALH